jgi:hypothetical protein
MTGQGRLCQGTSHSPSLSTVEVVVRARVSSHAEKVPVIWLSCCVGCGRSGTEWVVGESLAL